MPMISHSTWWKLWCEKYKQLSKLTDSSWEVRLWIVASMLIGLGELGNWNVTDIGTLQSRYWMTWMCVSTGSVMSATYRDMGVKVSNSTRVNFMLKETKAVPLLNVKWGDELWSSLVSSEFCICVYWLFIPWSFDVHNCFVSDYIIYMLGSLTTDIPLHLCVVLSLGFYSYSIPYSDHFSTQPPTMVHRMTYTKIELRVNDDEYAILVNSRKLRKVCSNNRCFLDDTFTSLNKEMQRI